MAGTCLLTFTTTLGYRTCGAEENLFFTNRSEIRVDFFGRKMFDTRAKTALHIPDLCFLSETCEEMAPENDDQKPSLLTRRGVLRLLALTGASLAAGSETSHAFVDFFSSYQSVSRGLLDKLDIPSDWIPQLGSQLPSYADFLERMRFRQMSIRQVIAPHAKSHGSVRNTLPPRYLWRNIRLHLEGGRPARRSARHARGGDRLRLPDSRVQRALPRREEQFLPRAQQRDRHRLQLSAGEGGRDGPRDALCRIVSRAASAATEASPTSTPAAPTPIGSPGGSPSKGAINPLSSFASQGKNFHLRGNPRNAISFLSECVIIIWESRSDRGDCGADIFEFRVQPGTDGRFGAGAGDEQEDALFAL